MASGSRHPYDLYVQAGGGTTSYNQDRYRALLIEHGHIAAPGGHGHAAGTVPCGWAPGKPHAPAAPAADLTAFDRYCAEHGVTGEQAPAAFAGWLRRIAAGQERCDVTGLITAQCGHCNGAARRELAEREEPAGYGAWLAARLHGRCAGPCGELIRPGDRIRSDGDHGWLCEDCGCEGGGP